MNAPTDNTPVSNQSTSLLGFTGLLVALSGFSMTGVWVRWLGEMDALAIVGWRVLVASLVLVPSVLFTDGPWGALEHLRSWRIHALCIRMTGFFVAAVIGFQLAPVALVIMFIGLSPAWILLFERISGKPVAAKQALGVGLVLAGAAAGLGPSLVAAASGDQSASSTATGAVLGLTSGFLTASYVRGRSTLSYSGHRPPSAVLLAMVTSLWGLWLLPISALTGRGNFIPQDLEWLFILGLGLMSTAAPLWGLATASRYLPPLFVALVTPLAPFTGAALAFVFLQEVPPPAFALGIPFIMAGLALVMGLLPVRNRSRPKTR